MPVDAGIRQGTCHVTAEMVNKWLFLPPIMHIFFSRLQNQSLQQISDNKENINVVLYAMRHHIHNFGISNVTGHHVMNLVYGMAKTKNLAQPQYCIILSSLFAAEIMVAATICIVKAKDEGFPDRRNRLNQGFQNVQNVWYTTNKYSQYAPFLNVLEGLSKEI